MTEVRKCSSVFISKEKRKLRDAVGFYIELWNGKRHSDIRYHVHTN